MAGVVDAEREYLCQNRKYFIANSAVSGWDEVAESGFPAGVVAE